jgi:hypothetical protein
MILEAVNVMSRELGSTGVYMIGGVLGVSLYAPPLGTGRKITQMTVVSSDEEDE